MIRATWFDGQTARRHDASIVIAAGRLHIVSPEVSHDHLLTDVEITPDLGSAPRWVRFADGSSCEVQDVAALRAALGIEGGSTTLVTQWHDDMRWVVAGLAGLVAALAAIYLFVLPPVADGMARRMPASSLDVLSQTAEGWLENGVFEPSQLPPERIAELRLLLSGLDLPVASDRLRLEVRRSPRLGANAIALPSGLIVITDELVQLSTDDRALTGILAHEVGHIEARHALRRIIQDSSVGMVVAGLLGDVNGAVLMVPTAFLSMRHSREFEDEADTFAIDVLTRMGVSLLPMADLLGRLDTSGSEGGYLSTHPPTPARVDRLRRASTDAR